MLEGFAAWRAMLHVSEWTGLSLGALAGLAALIWFVPLARQLAIVGMLLVFAAWIGLVHGEATGRADTQKQWDAEREAAIAAQQQRDAQIEQDLEAKYQPLLAELRKQSDERRAQGDQYETTIRRLAQNSHTAGGCQLGAAADRVRKP